MTLTTIHESPSPLVNELAGYYDRPIIHLTSAAPQDKLNESSVLCVDGDRISNKDLEPGSVAREALRRGLPLLLENPTSSQLLELCGFAVDASVALLLEGPDGRSSMGHYLSKELLMDAPGQLTVSNNRTEREAESDGSDKVESLGEGTHQETPQPSDIARSIHSLLSDIDSLTERLRVKSSTYDNIPPEKYRTHEVNPIDPEYESRLLADPTHKKTDRTQRMSMDVGYDLKLFAVDDPHYEKNLVVTTHGHGFDPGEKPIHNRNSRRGYFQERLRFMFTRQNNSGLHVRKYAPENADNVFEIATTTGYSTDLSADSSGKVTMKVSYKSEKTVKRELTEFSSRASNPNSRTTQIEFHAHLLQQGKRVYDPYSENPGKQARNWLDTKWYTWPKLSQQLFKPDTEVVYRTAPSFRGQETLSLEHRQYRVFGWFTPLVYWQSGGYLRKSYSVRVDFSKVRH